MQKRLQFGMLALLTTVVLLACNIPSSEFREIPPITEDELIGTWMADYSQFEMMLPLSTAKETIVLHPDGTFEQFLPWIQEIPWENSGTWAATSVSDYDTQLTLNGAVYYLEGSNFARFPKFSTTLWDNIASEEVTVTGGPSVQRLYARRKPYEKQPRCGREFELVLRHLPLGDPDAPQYVTFYRQCEE